MPKKRAAKNRLRSISMEVPAQEKVGENMTPEERQVKIEMLLTDFDAEVKTRTLQIQREIDKMCLAVSKLYRVELLKLPQKYKTMKYMEYCGLSGNIHTDALKEVDSLLDSLNERWEKENLTKQSTCHIIQEEEEVEIEKNVVNLKSNVKNSVKTNSRKILTFQQSSIPPATRSRLQLKQEIPYVYPNMSNRHWSTPAVTPKFDPSLPLVPSSIRQAKVGEKIMSLSGSPLVNTADLIKNSEDAIIILDNGQTIPLSDENNFTTLDHQTQEKIKLLHKKLGIILLPPKA